jgi:hypothetical protein
MATACTLGSMPAGAIPHPPGNIWTDKYPAIAVDLAKLTAQNAYLAILRITSSLGVDPVWVAGLWPGARHQRSIS